MKANIFYSEAVLTKAAVMLGLAFLGLLIVCSQEDFKDETLRTQDVVRAEVSGTLRASGEKQFAAASELVRTASSKNAGLGIGTHSTRGISPKIATNLSVPVLVEAGLGEKSPGLNRQARESNGVESSQTIKRDSRGRQFISKHEQERACVVEINGVRR